MKSPLRHFAVAAGTALVGLLLMIGCGVDHSPVAQDEAAMTRTPDGRLLLTFSPQATRRAAKIAQAPEDRTSSELIGAEGGTLRVEDENGKGKKDDLDFKFKVPENALDSEVLITMTIYGETLSDLVVEFAPGGLEFLKTAKLTVKLGENLIDAPLDQFLQVQHVHDDGTVEEAAITVSEDDGKGKIKVEVPGFSRYSLP